MTIKPALSAEEWANVEVDRDGIVVHMEPGHVMRITEPGDSEYGAQERSN